MTPTSASLGGKPAPVIDGTTGDQRFYLGWAQVWRGKIREAALRRQLPERSAQPGRAAHLGHAQLR